MNLESIFLYRGLKVSRKRLGRFIQSRRFVTLDFHRSRSISFSRPFGFSLTTFPCYPFPSEAHETCVNSWARYMETAPSIQQHFIKSGFSAASTISLSSPWGTLHSKYPRWRSTPPQKNRYLVVIRMSLTLLTTVCLQR